LGVKELQDGKNPDGVMLLFFTVASVNIGVRQWILPLSMILHQKQKLIETQKGE
jgi:hypothetical protein